MGTHKAKKGRSKQKHWLSENEFDSPWVRYIYEVRDYLFFVLLYVSTFRLTLQIIICPRWGGVMMNEREVLSRERRECQLHTTCITFRWGPLISTHPSTLLAACNAAQNIGMNSFFDPHFLFSYLIPKILSKMGGSINVNDERTYGGPEYMSFAATALRSSCFYSIKSSSFHFLLQ